MQYFDPTLSTTKQDSDTLYTSLKDAQEYFSYLVETAARAEHGAQQHWKFVPMTKLFELGLETRIECSISHRVSACVRIHFLAD